MPAIWGALSGATNEKTKMQFLKIEKNYEIYKIEKIIKKETKLCFFDYGHQIFNEEAKNEKLPILDGKNQILFVADCIIDNRQELLRNFSKLPPNCSDGKLLYEAYLKWNSKVTDYVLGAYSFAVYHLEDRKLELFTDHMGNRSIFYKKTEEDFFFSTAIVPLAKGTEAKECEKWLTGCLLNTSADMMFFEEFTPYENILQLPAACHLIYEKGKVKKQIYWSSDLIKNKLSHKAPMYYKDLFIQTVEKCTSSMMRTTGKIGCTLSGGLDSSTITAFAARKLQEREEKICSYTSVPLKDYVHKGKLSEIADETEGVMSLCEMYSNIAPSFLECQGQDAFSELSHLVPLIGYPMKSGPNLTWLDAIYKKASEDGCKLMLKGQYGNSTISWGKALSVFYQLLCQGHPILCLKFVKGFHRRYKVSRKRIAKYFLMELQNRFRAVEIDEDEVLCKKQLLQKYNIKKEFRRLQRRLGGGEMDSASQRIAFMFNPTGQMQLGMFDTVMSLIHGVLIRDPSKDKRIVELCCRLPVECGLAGYVERGMARTYMEGILPDRIRLDLVHRGVQGADYEFRSKQLWKITQSKVRKALSNQALSKYVEMEILEEIQEKIENTETKDLSYEDIRRANVLYSCSIFLESVKG